MARPESLVSKIPVVTLFFVCASLITYGWPYLSELLVYDRQAILEGELWRIFTAPLVHFSTSHLFWNLLVFAAAGWVAETTESRGFWIVCGFSAISPGLIFLWASPELIRYGGLSGLASGAVAYLCLCKAMTTGKHKLLWLTILVLIGVKIMIEVTTANPIFVRTGTPFHVLPAAHFWGCVGALVALAWSRPNKELQTDVTGS
ncbi:MAG: rhombosortase [Desulfuromonadales bacterium]|nr:rhombosortase [Desulfuromonadales bacterium]